MSGYTLETMLAARVLRHPDRTLLRAARGGKNATWTYAEVAHRLRILAGLFCRLESEPRVAIFSENSIDSACCDLACLVHRIFDTPLNVHFDEAILAWIFNRLGINIVITDTEERALRLAEVRSQIGRSFYILNTGTDESETVRSIRGAELLDEVCARTDLQWLRNDGSHRRHHHDSTRRVCR
jgi:long-subunit acyl-CoA synthetase (AMP-forming)